MHWDGMKRMQFIDRTSFHLTMFLDLSVLDVRVAYGEIRLAREAEHKGPRALSQGSAAACRCEEKETRGKRAYTGLCNSDRARSQLRVRLNLPGARSRV